MILRRIYRFETLHLTNKKSGLESNSRIHFLKMDVTEPLEISQAAQDWKFEPIQILINSSGFLHPEKSVAQVC
jgi:short-subunit dehydrogenase